jgi:hypothetical protein
MTTLRSRPWLSLSLLVSVTPALGCDSTWHDETIPAGRVVVESDRQVQGATATQDSVYWIETIRSSFTCQLGQEAEASRILAKDLVSGDITVLVDGSVACAFGELLVVDGVLYFAAYPRANIPQVDLWRYDLASEELELVPYAAGDAPPRETENPFFPGPVPANLTEQDGAVVFVAGDSIYRIADADGEAVHAYEADGRIDRLFLDGDDYYFTRYVDDAENTLRDETIELYRVTSGTGTPEPVGTIGPKVDFGNYYGVAFEAGVFFAPVAAAAASDVSIRGFNSDAGAVETLARYEGVNQQVWAARGGRVLVGEAWGGRYDFGWVKDGDGEPQGAARVGRSDSGFSPSTVTLVGDTFYVSYGSQLLAFE